MTITINPTNLQALGAAKEPAYGVAATTPTVWFPMTDPKWEPHIAQFKDDSLRGDMAANHGQVPGMRYDTLDFSNYFLTDVMFQDHLNVLGYPDAVTGSGDPYTHATSLLNTSNGQPTSWTLWLSNGAECWQMTGCHLGNVGVEIPAEGLAKITKQWMGLPAQIVTAPTNVPSTTQPMPGWNTTVTLGGVGTAIYSSLKIDMKRELTAVPSLGQQAPLLIAQGALTVTGEHMGVYQGYTAGPTDLQNYLTSVQTTLVAQTSPKGDAAHFARWQMSKVAYDSAAVTGAAGKYLEVDAKWEALANATDQLGGIGQSPLKFSLATPVATAY